MRIEFIVRGEPRPKGSKSAMVYNWPRGKDKGKVAARIRALATQLLSKPWSFHPQTALREVSKTVGKWQEQVKRDAQAAMAAHERPIPSSVPVRLTTIFFMQRPKGHFGTGRNDGKLKEQFKEVFPLKVPDLSKLIRAVEDGMNGVVFEDDSQIVESVAKKLYGHRNGVRIIVETVTYREVKTSDPEQLLLFANDKEL